MHLPVPGLPRWGNRKQGCMRHKVLTQCACSTMGLYANNLAQMSGAIGLSRSAKRITGGRSVKGKICLSEASYFPFSGDTGNSALLLQPFPLLPWKARGD